MAGDDGIYVVGAGLAGLACAHHLLDHGVNATVLEAADGVGGRVRTDVVDGFLLDRGFQMLLTAYPEAKGLLDYRALELHPFSTAALIRMDGRFVKVTDPFRRPLAALSALLAPVGSIRDKLRLARLRRRALREDLATMLARPEAPTGGALLRRAATKVERGKLTLAGGELLRPAAVVVATDGPSASWLLGERVLAPPGSMPAICLYFATEHPPLDEPILVLNGEGAGPVSHCCVPSAVSPTYAPAGGHLVSVSVLGAVAPGEELERAVVGQLADWFGSGVLGWDLLGTYRIEHAQPAQPVGALDPPERPVRLEPGLYLCGDHRDNASINGALASGRRAATALLEDLRGGAIG